MPELPDIDAHWDYERPEQTEWAFRALLPRAEAAGADAYRLEVLTQIARAEGLQRKFAAAHATLDVMATELGDDLMRPRIRYLLERGRVQNSAGEPSRGVALFLEAFELARASGEDALAVDAAHMLGIVEPPEEQLAWTRRAIALAEESSRPAARRWLGSLYNNLGWSLHDQGHFAEALATFEAAVAWQVREANEAALAIARWCVARTLRSLARLAEALAIQQELQARLERLGETDGYVEEELAECLLALGRPDEATAHFAHAHAALAADPWLVEREPARLQRLSALGRSEAAGPDSAAGHAKLVATERST